MANGLHRGHSIVQMYNLIFAAIAVAFLVGVLGNVQAEPAGSPTYVLRPNQLLAEAIICQDGADEIGFLPGGQIGSAQHAVSVVFGGAHLRSLSR